MSEDPNRYESAEKAHEIGNLLLKYLMKEKCPENIAQAALGIAWYEVCLSMGLSYKTFSMMCESLKEEYKIEKEENDTRN